MIKGYSVVIILFLLTFAVVGCVTPTSVSRQVLVDNNNSVRLEALVDKSGNTVSQGFDHPVNIAEDQMRRILASIRTVEPPNVISKLVLKAKTQAEEAFSAEEVEFLAIPLATAFQKATPDERVSFFLYHPRSFHRSTSSGIAFVKNGQMNFILGRYHIRHQPGKPDIDVSGNPLPETSKQNFYIEAGPYQKLVGDRTAPGSKEPVYEDRWVAISYKDLLESSIEITKPSSTVTAPSETVSPQPPAAPVETVSPQPSATPAETVSPRPSATPVETVSPQPSATPAVTVLPHPSTAPAVTVLPHPSTAPAVTVLPQPSATPVETVSPQPPAAPVETVSPQTPSEISSKILEEKLRTLKRLKQEELITEEEYRQKKQELLRSF